MKFTEEFGRRYMGRMDSVHVAYAADEDVRVGAASGGVVSGLLLHLLEKRAIDAALVTATTCSAQGIGAQVLLARDRAQVLSAQTSKYSDVPVAAQSRKLIKAFPGNVAVVALPCHTTALRLLAQRDPEIGQRLKFIITLFCGHSSEQALLDSVLQKQGIKPTEVDEFAYRRGHWRGRMGGTLRDGRTFSFPFKFYSMYHNLNFFCLPRCLSCHDHTGYESDFSVGDVWLRQMKDEPIKHSLLVTRNQQARTVIDDMIGGGTLTARPADPALVFRAQKRSLIYHYNVSARARAARRYGMDIKDTVNTKVRWNDYLAARLIIMNYRWSRNPRRRDWILRIPRPIMFVYFCFLKFLQNF